MRCPKCGYISFDQVEVCGKCSKDIGEAASKLRGMVQNVIPPLFLRVDAPDESSDEDDKTVTLGEETEIPGEENGSVEFTLHSEQALDQDSDMAMDLDGFDLETDGAGSLEESLVAAEHSEMELDEPDFDGVDLTDDQEGLDFDGVDLGGDTDELDFDGVDLADGADEALSLDAEDDLGAADNGLVDPGGSAVEKVENKGLELDFGEIDLSDLAPPTNTDSESLELSEPVALEDEGGVAEIEMDFGLSLDDDFALADEDLLSSTSDSGMAGDDLVEEEAVVVNPAPAGSGLADLKVEELEISSSALKSKGEPEAASSELLKTGTALDSFDLDLGELFSEKND